MSGTAEDMVKAMAALIGAHESNGNNKNYITHWYGLDGQPWCDQAVTYAAFHSGNEQSTCFGTKHAYTVEHAQKFKDHDQWHAMTNGVHASGIRRGDVIFFDWSGGSTVGAIDHVGLVESVSGSVVHTIEGNFNNVCGRFARTVEVIAGYGRPKYKAPPAPAKHAAPKGGAKFEPFPGAAYFKRSPKSDLVTRMGKRLVAERCGAYDVGPGPQWSVRDQESYRKWQRKCGFTGADADGWPGASSWAKLQVPKA